MKYSRQLKHLSVLDPIVAGVQDFISNGSFGRFNLWYDPILNKQYEEYSISACGSDKDFQIYQFRRDQWQNLISICHVSETASLGFSQLRVFTQRIPLLLSELITISFQQCLFILRQSIIGFEVIMEKYGSIHIEDRMIGINQQGKIKVWSNSKYEKTYPQIPIVTVNWLSSTQAELQMVTSLFNSVEKHCIGGQQLLRFQKSKPQNMNFARASNYIFDFVLQSSIQLPQTLNHYLSSSSVKKIKNERILALQAASRLSESLDEYMLMSRDIYNKPQSNLSFSAEYPSINLFSESRKEANYNDINGIPSISISSSTKKLQSHWGQNANKKTKYFTQGRSDTIISGSKSKDKMTIKSSWTSKDLSFKSTTNSHQKKTIKKQGHRKYFPTNDEQFMIDSQYQQYFPTTQLQRAKSHHYQLTSDHFQITKSVMVNNNQERQQSNQNLEKNIGGSQRKPLTIETGFEYLINSNAVQPVSVQTTPTRSRNLSSLSQFRSIKNSVIKGGSNIQAFNKNGLLMISKLKSSFFNKLDDLKRSIISQHLNQASQVDVSSPLLIKTRASAMRNGAHPFFSLIRCTQQQPFSLKISENIQDYSHSIHRSATNTKQTILRQIVQAEGQ